MSRLTINVINFARSTAGAVIILTNNASNGPKIIPKIVPMIENINPIIKPKIVRMNSGIDESSRIEIFNSDNSLDNSLISILELISIE